MIAVISNRDIRFFSLRTLSVFLYAPQCSRQAVHRVNYDLPGHTIASTVRTEQGNSIWMTLLPIIHTSEFPGNTGLTIILLYSVVLSAVAPVTVTIGGRALSQSGH